MRGGKVLEKNDHRIHLKKSSSVNLFTRHTEATVDGAQKGVVSANVLPAPQPSLTSLLGQCVKRVPPQRLAGPGPFLNWVMQSAPEATGEKKYGWPSFLNYQFYNAECKHLHDFLKKTKFDTSKNFLAYHIWFPLCLQLGRSCEPCSARELWGKSGGCSGVGGGALGEVTALQPKCSPG